MRALAEFVMRGRREALLVAVTATMLPMFFWLGAAVIGLVSTFPQLIWLSEHKVGLFIFAGIMLTISGITRYLTRNAPCPADPVKAKACTRMRRFSLGIFLFSLGMYLVGFYFAFIAAKLM